MSLRCYLVDLRSISDDVSNDDLKRTIQLLDDLSFTSDQRDIGLFEVRWEESDPPIEKVIDFPEGSLITEI